MRELVVDGVRRKTDGAVALGARSAEISVRVDRPGNGVGIGHDQHGVARKRTGKPWLG